MLHGVSVNTSYNNNTDAPVRVQTYNAQTNSWESSGGAGHQTQPAPQRITSNTTWETEVMPKIIQDLNDSTAWARTGNNDATRSTNQWSSSQPGGTGYTTRTSSDWYNSGDTDKDVKVDVRPGGEIQIQFQPNMNQYNPPQAYVDVQRSFQPSQSQGYSSDNFQQNNDNTAYSSGTIQYPYRPGNTSTQFGGGGIPGMPIIRAECSSGEIPNISFSVQPAVRNQQQSYTITREEPLVTYYQTTSQQVQPQSTFVERNTSGYKPFETDITETRQTKRIIETTDKVIEHPPVTVRSGFTVSTDGAAQTPKTNVTSWGGANNDRVQSAVSSVPPEIDNSSQFGGQARDGWSTAPVAVQQKPFVTQNLQRGNNSAAVPGQYPWGNNEQSDSSRQQNYSSTSGPAYPGGAKQTSGPGVGYNQQINRSVSHDLPPWVKNNEQSNCQAADSYPAYDTAEYQAGNQSQNYGVQAAGRGALSSGNNQSYQQSNSPRSPPAVASYQSNNPSVQSPKVFAENRGNQPPPALQRYPSNQATSPRAYQEAPFQRQSSNNQVTSYQDDYQDSAAPHGYQESSPYGYQQSDVQGNLPPQNYQSNSTRPYSAAAPQGYQGSPTKNYQASPLQTYPGCEPLQPYQSNAPDMYQPNNYQQGNPQYQQNNPQYYQNNSLPYQQQPAAQVYQETSPNAYQGNAMPGYPGSAGPMSPQAYQNQNTMSGKQVWQPPGSAGAYSGQQPMFNAQNTYQDEYQQSGGYGYQNDQSQMIPSGPAPPPPPPLMNGGRCLPPMAPPPPPVEVPSNKNVYGPSAVKEGVNIAKSVAHSVMSPENENSRGQSMFLRRQQNAEKWTTSGGGDGYQDNNYGNNSSAGGQQNAWSASSGPAPTRSMSQQPSYPGQATKRNSFPGSQSPLPFGPGLADDTKNMGKGGALFAKRKERADKWNAADNAVSGGNVPRPNVVGTTINRQTSLNAPQEGGQHRPLNMTVMSGAAGHNRQPVGSTITPVGQYGYGGGPSVNKCGYTDL